MLLWEKKCVVGTALLSVGIFFWGYHDLVVPVEKESGFLQGRVLKTQQKRVKKIGLSQPPVSLNEKQEIARWSSSNGRLLLWKVGGGEVAFRWEGAYSRVLNLLRHWPAQFTIKQMHWKRGKAGYVLWSGRYEVPR